jgi:hypothetical protein
LYMIMFVFIYIFIFGSIFHIWEKACGLCLSEPSLLYLTWCPPIASIYLQTIQYHSSLLLNKTPLYTHTHTCVCVCIYICVYIYHIYPIF